MPRDLRKYFYDIEQACKLLAEFTSGKTFADYTTDAMLRSAVERQFEIIGEALSWLCAVHRHWPRTSATLAGSSLFAIGSSMATLRFPTSWSGGW